jgi:hypothetical protein
LDRALALVQVQALAKVIAEHLHLDVARVGDVLLQHQGRIAKRLLRFAGSEAQTSPFSFQGSVKKFRPKQKLLG